MKYHTIDKYYQFKNSKLFQKIFYSIDDEIISPSTGNRTTSMGNILSAKNGSLSLEEFDKISEEVLF